jgi:alpha-glucosidase (family GH31 glycosyl hydrolase)
VDWFPNKDKINQILTRNCRKVSMPLPPVPTFSPNASPEAIVTAGNVRFTVLTSRLIRLEYSKDGQFEDKPSQVFWYRRQPVPVFQKSISTKSIDIETDHLLLQYRPNRFGFTRWTLSVRLKKRGVKWHYGDRSSANLKGTARTLDGDFGNTRLEDGLLSRSGWTVVNDSDSLVFNKAGWLEPRIRRQKDLYFFGYGIDVADCLQDFIRIAGPIPMIPRYILGNWWSRYWEYSQDELQSLMAEFRSRGIPLSVCIVDMDWHITKTGNTSDGLTGYTWNRELFPDPPGFIHWLHEQGLRTALNLHPARGIHPHEEQYDAMAKWMGINPSTKEPIAFDITDPNFVEGYLDILHHPYEKMGVDFWWMDWQQGRKSRIPGLDPLWWINHLHFYDLGRDGRKRPFVFSRWGGLGNHRYPIGFSGDTIVRWRTLAYQPFFTANAANVGYGWWSHDIGGHMFKDGTPELYLRWIQFGVFSPIFRMHSTKKAALDRRPWSKPERIYHAAKEAMQLRHALIPYIYSMAWRAHRTGISLVTPMYYGNMEEASAFEAKDQYFFGSELLVAPVLKPAHPKTGRATRKAWFPSGAWFNLFTGEKVSEGGWREIEAALEDIPVFARSGAIVPLAPKVAWGGVENPSELDIYIFPGADNEFLLYEDDGETTEYRQGKYAFTRFTLEGDQFTIHPAEGELSLIPVGRTYRLQLRGVDERVHASLPGIYDTALHALNIEPVKVMPGQKFTLALKIE